MTCWTRVVPLISIVLIPSPSPFDLVQTSPPTLFSPTNTSIFILSRLSSLTSTLYPLPPDLLPPDMALTCYHGCYLFSNTIFAPITSWLTLWCQALLCLSAHLAVFRRRVERGGGPSIQLWAQYGASPPVSQETGRGSCFRPLAFAPSPFCFCSAHKLSTQPALPTNLLPFYFSIFLFHHHPPLSSPETELIAPNQHHAAIMVFSAPTLRYVKTFL